jgi:hypothetical protein
MVDNMAACQGSIRPFTGALAARAVKQQTGVWPKSITFYYFTDGTAVIRPIQQLRRPEILAKLAAQLRRDP